MDRKRVTRHNERNRERRVLNVNDCAITECRKPVQNNMARTTRRRWERADAMIRVKASHNLQMLLAKLV